jgi:DNA-binding response OmpR family regulator
LSGSRQILLLSVDLVTQSRVESAASRSGVTVRTVSDAAALVATFDELPAQLVIVDLAMPSVNLAATVAELKSRRESQLTIMAFGPHVQEARLAAAEAAGCDEVLSRGQFFSQLDAILARLAAAPD